MNPPSPELQRTARRLIEDAAAGGGSASAIVRAAEQVFQRLHDHLAKLIGVVGFKAMLARSLKLAQARTPTLRRIEVAPEGRLVGLAEAIEARSPAEAIEGPTTLLACFIFLLAEFVGEDFALHLVREAARKDDDRDDASRNEASANGHGSRDDR